MNCFHDFQIGEVEEDRLEVEVVAGEVGAAGLISVIGWREEGEGRTGGLSFSDLHWLGY